MPPKPEKMPSTVTEKQPESTGGIAQVVPPPPGPPAPATSTAALIPNPPNEPPLTRAFIHGAAIQVGIEKQKDTKAMAPRVAEAERGVSQGSLTTRAQVLAVLRGEAEVPAPPPVVVLEEAPSYEKLIADGMVVKDVLRVLAPFTAEARAKAGESPVETLERLTRELVAARATIGERTLEQRLGRGKGLFVREEGAGRYSLFALAVEQGPAGVLPVEENRVWHFIEDEWKRKSVDFVMPKEWQ